MHKGQNFPLPGLKGYVVISSPSCSLTWLAELRMFWKNASRTYEKFQICFVDISTELNNAILIGGKHQVTTIVVLSDEKLAPCHGHTYASHTYKVVRPKITEWQSVPFIYSVTFDSILNIYLNLRRQWIIKKHLHCMIKQWSSLISPKNEWPQHNDGS